MDFKCLPKDIQEKIIKLASQYLLSIDEVTKLYLMGGEHTDTLCQLKIKNVPDILIQLQNQELWDEKNKELLPQISGLD